mgnify:CR=1 FL=1
MLKKRQKRLRWLCAVVYSYGFFLWPQGCAIISGAVKRDHRIISDQEHKLLERQFSRKYPRTSYLKAWGAGSSWDLAAANGRALVSSQVQSTIQSRLDDKRTINNWNSVSTSSQTVDYQVSSFSKFNRAELLKEVDESRHVYGDQKYVLVILSKDDLKKKIQYDYEQKRPIFEVACQKMLRSSKKNNNNCAAFSRLRSHYHSLEVLSFQWYGAFGYDLPAFNAASRCYNKVAATVSKREKQQFLTISDQRLTRYLRTSITTRIKDVAIEYGYTVYQSKSCKKGLFMEVRGAVRCDTGYLGYQCDITPRATIKRCNNKTKTVGQIEFRSVLGVDPTDEENAKRRITVNVGKMPVDLLVRELSRLAGRCDGGNEDDLIAH